MNKAQTFEDFLASQTPHVPLTEFTINLVLTLILASVLAAIYTRCGSPISNRKAFSKNLVLIAMTTMVIITVVKSSLALSLGLVGALSIVRFRTPIKEPEELSYLFISICIGLALGAGQRAVLLIGFLAMVGFIWMRYRRKPSQDAQSMHLTVAIEGADNQLLDRVVEVLEESADAVTLRRVDESQDSLQGDFSVAFDDYAQFAAVKQRLRELDQRLRISMLDNRLI